MPYAWVGIFLPETRRQISFSVGSIRFYQCLEYSPELGKYMFERSYQEEGPEFHPSWNGVEIYINSRKLSTYLNALVQSGLILDQLIESEPNSTLARETGFGSREVV